MTVRNRSTRQVPGTGNHAVNRGAHAAINAASCASAWNCSAGGYYTEITSARQAFVVSQG